MCLGYCCDRPAVPISGKLAHLQMSHTVRSQTHPNNPELGFSVSLTGVEVKAHPGRSKNPPTGTCDGGTDVSDMQRHHCCGCAQ